MSTFLLLHGAGSDSWYWHRVRPLLPASAAPDLPVTDETCSFEEYADIAAASVDGPVTVVAQSLSGFVAPLLCSRLDVREIRMVCAMTPRPGESAGQWWEASGQAAAQRAADVADGRDPDALFDPAVTFLHDVPSEVAEAGLTHVFPQAGRPFDDPFPLGAWPDVPTRFLAGTEDRLFPLGFQRRMARERLAVEAEEIATGHLPALAQPEALAAWLLA
jgi:pimeloyl-ACP methyl ester carboxylesterase